jgi:hypothetical protein
MSEPTEVRGIVRQLSTGKWAWRLEDYYGVVIDCSRIPEPNRREAILKVKAAKAEYANKLTRMMKAKKKGAYTPNHFRNSHNFIATRFRGHNAHPGWVQRLPKTA